MANQKKSSQIFSILDALRFGFYTIIEHFAFYIALMLSYVAILTGSFIITVFFVCLPFYKRMRELAALYQDVGLPFFQIIKNIIRQLGQPFILVAIVGIIFLYFVVRLLNLGITKIALEFYDNDESSLKTLFKPWRLLLRDTIASILYALICSIGYMLLVIPGIYFMLTLRFYHQFIVDKNLGIFEAFRLSTQLTHGAKWQLFALFLLLNFFRWIALSIFGVTLLIVMPLVSLVNVHVYRKLLERKKLIKASV